jgi:CheY-like chemotaxis protein
MGKTLKLLWIDDMENWAQSAQNNLKIIARKYEIDLVIVSFKNGEGILQQLNIDFDGIIMDYHMDPFNGDKYIRDIRFEEHLEHIPILFYSQDNSSQLDTLVKDLKNVTTVYRPNLEHKIIETYFK